ncbi:MAG: manganese efflux pump [Bacteroidaceae bacterium]|nr:manganese efflux pump [Bacteroidaceae bacterium]
MTHIESWIIAFALAMDCFAVSIASGVIFKQYKWRKMLLISFLFGLFQAINPLLGWTGTGYCRHFIESVDHWIAFGILLYLGIQMIRDSFKDEEHKNLNPESLRMILIMAVATSIDAFAVGISFSCMGILQLSTLLYPLMAIGVTSFLMSMTGLLLGIRFGKGFAQSLRAELCGGVILIIIGTKVLIEHTC